MARCACYCCRAVMPLPDVHHCQRECNPYSVPTFHFDFCQKCKVKMLAFWLNGTKRIPDGGKK